MPLSRWSNLAPVNSGMTTPAPRMKNAVIAPRTISMIQSSVEASRSASLRLPCWSSSVNTGTNAADSAALANRLLTRLGTWKAIVKAEKGPLVPKNLATAISRTRPATREKLVAIEKIAALRATRPPPGGGCSPVERSGASGIPAKAAIVRRLRDGQYPLPEEAHPALRARAPGEPSLHLDGQDLLPAPGVAGGKRRRRGGRQRPSRARLGDRQGGQARRPATQQRRPQEVPGRAHPRRQARLAGRAPARRGIPRQ